MRNRTAVTALLVCIAALQCKNPFLPPKGLPVVQTSRRSTPQGLLDQLIDAYESRDIEPFTDLLPKDGSFRFFIAPDYFKDNTARYSNLKEPRDERLQFIGQEENYYYWTQESEIQRHTRLFSQVTTIEFTEKPAIGSIRKFADNGDSLAELLITGGSLEVSRYLDPYTVEIFTVEISEQVFLVRKEEDGMWVISKWYDFSREEG